MITYDEVVTDPLGANAFLGEFFKPDDLTNELAHQVLAQQWFYDEDIWNA